MNEATTNPALGVVIFALGGLAGAVFYLPFKKVKNWAWESYWFIYAVAGLIVVPWVLALITSPNVTSVLKQAPGKELWYCYLCGAAWGVGGLTWGLMIRYLGVGLGLAIGCGLCAAAGTLIPPIIKPWLNAVVAGAPLPSLLEGVKNLHGTPAANMSLIGVGISLLGIILVGMAGMSKEKELPEEQKRKAVAEYNFKLGLVVAIFSGLMSSALGMGLQGGGTIEALAQTTEPATPVAWKGMPVLVVALLGGFTVNALWCLFLNVKNKTTGDYTKSGTPLLANLMFAGLAGAIWCSQFICFKTGEPQMGATSYIGWSVLMASAILFSTLLGIFLGEWSGTSGRTQGFLAIGLIFLLGSAVVAGYSGKLSQERPAALALPAAPTS
ncbi:MAG TPA: L-rhamnose/proton symporter RhaT [Candidatus Paceibacterota bacterium]|nr:L-rhamnose/proton symporter RhaT [Verrucomicrobiota bacterium]HSA12101.1 L-rhamnose/proton symporter RhaT [Candidatus Paceibacterota bacterium]